MKTTFLIAACSLTAALALPAEDVLTTRTETFDSNTGFLSAPRGVTTDGFDIGWSDSNRASGEAPGEFGGTFGRGGPFHYWADTDIGDVSRRDELEVTGKFVITEEFSMVDWIVVGYANTDRTYTRNEIGMGISEPFSTGALFRVSAVSQYASAIHPYRIYDNAPGRIPIGGKASFRFVWMPSASRNGTGTATLTLTLEGGEEFVSIVEDPRVPGEPEGIEFDLFIIGGSGIEINPGAPPDINRKMVVFFDDITYTVRGAPASTDDVFGGQSLDDDWFFSSWYGTYNTAFWPWVFHLEHGFQFVFETGVDGDVFLFDGNSGGWWFTSASQYPNSYIFARNAWVFYFSDTASPRNFVDLNSGEFFDLD